MLIYLLLMCLSSFSLLPHLLFSSLSPPYILPHPPHKHILLNHVKIVATFMILYLFTSTLSLLQHESKKQGHFFFKTTISLTHSRVKYFSTLSSNKIHFLIFPRCPQMTCIAFPSTEESLKAHNLLFDCHISLTSFNPEQPSLSPFHLIQFNTVRDPMLHDCHVN